MKVLVSAFRFLVFSNIYISICTVAFTAKTSLLLYGNCGDWKVNILIFFATVFLYCFHRLYNRGKMIPEERREERHHWADEHSVIFIAITITSFVCVAILMFFMPLRVWVLLIPVAVLGLGYSLPFIPSRRGFLRLRDLSWLKALWIALAFGWITTLIPVVFQTSIHNLLDIQVLFVFLRSILFILVLVIPFDIRDLQHDVKNGMKTIATLLGPAKSVLLAYFLLFVFSSLVLIQFTYYQLSSKIAITLLISGVEVYIVVPLSKKPKPDLFYSLAIESSMIFHFVVLFIAIKLF